MRISLLSKNDHPEDGASRLAETLTPGLRAQGQDAALFTIRSDLAPPHTRPSHPHALQRRLSYLTFGSEGASPVAPSAWIARQALRSDVYPVPAHPTPNASNPETFRPGLRDAAIARFGLYPAIPTFFVSDASLAGPRKNVAAVLFREDTNKFPMA